MIILLAGPSDQRKWRRLFKTASAHRLDCGVLLSYGEHHTLAEFSEESANWTYSEQAAFLAGYLAHSSLRSSIVLHISEASAPPVSPDPASDEASGKLAAMPLLANPVTTGASTFYPDMILGHNFEESAVDFPSDSLAGCMRRRFESICMSHAFHSIILPGTVGDPRTEYGNASAILDYASALSQLHQRLTGDEHA